jgi:hypothetical protein
MGLFCINAALDLICLFSRQCSNHYIWPFNSFMNMDNPWNSSKRFMRYAIVHIILMIILQRVVTQRAPTRRPSCWRHFDRSDCRLRRRPKVLRFYYLSCTSDQEHKCKNTDSYWFLLLSLLIQRHRSKVFHVIISPYLTSNFSTKHQFSSYYFFYYKNQIF